MTEGDITLEELLAHITRQTEETEGYLTTTELVEKSGYPESRVRRALRELSAKGMLKSRWVVRPNIAGSAQRIPGYKVIAERRNDDEGPKPDIRNGRYFEDSE